MTAGESAFGSSGVKLLALLLAWGIWFVVREDLEEPAAMTTVVVRAPPGSNVEGEIVGGGAVSVKLKGARRDIEMIVGAQRPLVANLRAEDLAPDQYTGSRDFHADDLAFPEPVRPGSVRIVEMEPETLAVRLWRVERREIQLAPPEFPGTDELNVQVERKRWPPKVVVRAPSQQLKDVLVLRTTVDREQLRRHVEAMGDAARTTVTLPLALVDVPPGVLTVIEPRSLEATADLVRNVETTVTVRLSVLRDVAAPARDLTIVDPRKPWFHAGDPPTITLALRGSPRAVASIPPGSVRAFLLESELAVGANAGELRVRVADLPPGVLPRDELLVPVRTAR